MSSIQARKKEHLRIVAEEDVQFRTTTGFERWRFIHNAMPEIDLKDVDTRCEFLGYKINQPFMIAAIGGGESRGLELNRDLAQVANAARVPLVLGSMRILLEDSAVLPSFKIARQLAPDIPIIANLGAAQLNDNLDSRKVLRAIQDIGADALSIHLNPLQEALQPEGEPSFRNVSHALEILKETLPVPLIVKEVGCGLSLDVLKRLYKIGIKWVDIAGAGGTSWAKVEYHRILEASAKQLAAEFFEWGIPTAEALTAATQLKDLHLIATGGIDSGLNYAKAIALGAELAGAAAPFVTAWRKKGQEGIAQLLDHYQRTLQMAMFLTGCAKLKKFRGNAAIIQSQNYQNI